MKNSIIKISVALSLIFAISYVIGDLAGDRAALTLMISLYGLLLVEYKDIAKLKILVIILFLLFYHIFIWDIFDWHNKRTTEQSAVTETISSSQRQ